MITRRSLAAGLLAGASLPAWAQPASSWRPSRPIRLIVTFPAGGTDDRVARILAQALTPRLGVPVEVENVPGDLGNRAIAALREAPADGHALLLGSSTALASNATLFPGRVPIPPLEAMAPISRVGINTILLVTPTARPWQDVAALAAAARARPGALRLGTAGEGSMSHVYGVALAEAAGVQLKIVHLAGGAGTAAALRAGEVDAVFTQIGTLLPLVTAGQARPLMVGSGTRAVWVPDLVQVPAADDAFPAAKIDAMEWWAVVGHAETPAHILEAIRTHVFALVDADTSPGGVRAQLDAMGILPAADPALADFRAVWQAELAKWQSYGRLVNLAR